MMQYNRSGVYLKHKKKAKKTFFREKKSVDFVNVFLFVLLAVVVVLFVVT
jgi:hypothetical protein